MRGRLEEVGYGVGIRLLEVLCYRERSCRRETRLLDILKFVHSTLWKYLFGRQARDLEQSNTVQGGGGVCRVKCFQDNVPVALGMGTKRLWFPAPLLHKQNGVTDSTTK